MKHSLFSILLLAGAFACLPGIKKIPGTEFYTCKSPTAAPTNVQPANEAGSLNCTLPAPDSFNGERTSGTTAALSWSTVPNAVAYRLIVKDLDTDEVIVNSLEYGTSRSLSGLDPGTSYRCILASVCLGGTTSDYIVITDVLE